MNVLFVVVKPESKRKTFSVRLPILIGRSEEAKFRIQQDRVSRRHCEVFTQDGNVYLRDLGSTNGTFLNGELIDTSARHPLEPGALVRVGSLEFRVDFESAGGVTVAIADADAAAATDDRTVGVPHAADSDHLRVEHAADEAEPAGLATGDPAGQERRAEPEAEQIGLLTAERPPSADEPPRVELAEQSAQDGGPDPEAEPAETAGIPDQGFGFLEAADDAEDKADDEGLGDFLKGLG